jgi:hypothetical protein
LVIYSTTTAERVNLMLSHSFEQIEAISKARLCLSLKAPDDDMTLEEKNALYGEQRMRILNFVELLHDSLLCEHGKVLLCLYQCS